MDVLEPELKRLLDTADAMRSDLLRSATSERGAASDSSTRALNSTPQFTMVLWLGRNPPEKARRSLA